MIKKLLITAGPTREHLDPVRFISNLSSGALGYALARVAVKRGYQVSLVSGPTSLTPPPGVRFYPVISALEMRQKCTELFPKHDGLIMSAAVSDFMPFRLSRQKMPSGSGRMLKLKRTPDILAGLSKRKGKRVVIGFCLETKDLIRKAKKKLIAKHLDGIVANGYDPKKHIPFGQRRIRVKLIDHAMKVRREPLQVKEILAGRILNWMKSICERI
jgi:phosphopantothenoylcysteine decarboxylase/phosphopantothenate--cysteine ligase